MELIAKFDRRITIQYPDGSVNADTGEPSGTFTTLASVWANRMSKKGSDRLLGEQTVSVGDEVFKIRYRDDVTEKMRVVFKSRNYEIKSVHEVGRNESMVIICERLT